MRYYGIEPMLIDLKSRGEQVAHIYIKDHKAQYDFVAGEVSQAHHLRNLGEAAQCVIETLADRGEAWIGLEGPAIYSYLPSTEAGLLYFGEVKLVTLPNDRRKVRYPVVQFEDGTICQKLSDFLEYFKLENNYSNRGKVMRWLSSLDGPTTKLRTRKQKFDRKKVINLEMGTNRFGKPTAILHYRRLPAMVGLKPMLDTFPDLTPTQVQELYSDYGIALPGTFKRAFKEHKKPDPDLGDDKPEELTPIDERPLRIPEPYQPLDEEIQPPDKKVLWGYIHATGLYPRRGKVMGSNPIHVGDIPIKNEKELKKFLEQWRYSIDDKLLHRLWNFVLEGNGEQQ